MNKIELGNSGIGTNWEITINNFIDDRKVNGCSERTIRYYEDSLDYFHSFCKSINIIAPESVNAGNIKQYIVYLKEERGNSNTTINIKLRALRAFFIYLADNNYVSTRLKIKQIKEEKKIIETFNEDQIRVLIEKPDLSNISFARYRDYCMVAFLLGTGVRLQTLKNIKVKDINFREREITLVHTKAKKQQIIPLSKTLATILEEYLRRTRLDEDDYLFCNQYKERISDKSIEDRIKRYCDDRKVSENSTVRCSPHTFRHTFAKQALMNGMDLLTLQKILGHSTLDMVRRYVNLLTDDLKKNFTSPLDTLYIKKGSGRKKITL